MVNTSFGNCFNRKISDCCWLLSINSILSTLCFLILERKQFKNQPAFYFFSDATGWHGGRPKCRQPFNSRSFLRQCQNLKVRKSPWWTKPLFQNRLHIWCKQSEDICIHVCYTFVSEHEFSVFVFLTSTMFYFNIEHVTGLSELYIYKNNIWIHIQTLFYFFILITLNIIQLEILRNTFSEIYLT